MNILEEIAEYTRIRIAKEKENISLEEMKRMAYACKIDDTFPFEQALREPGISFICECKKASPSKGLIAPDFPYVQIAKEYEHAKASCISCLSEPHWFLGSDQYVKEISESVSIPVLRKDFTVDEYMIYQAKVLGASCILLICSILDENTLKRYHDIATDLGLSCLVEAHDDQEVLMAKRIGAKIIGVNNRNLKDFTVDIHNAGRYRKLVDGDILFVAESGIKTHEDILALEADHVDAVLIGETLMKATDKKRMLDILKGEIYE